MNGWIVTGILLVLALIIGIGIYSGRKVKDSSDFLAGGGKSGAWLVAGSIMGSLVSSQATIGTAQLAFHYGLAAWWFTLGSGIGCLVLALFYAAPLRKSGCITEMQIISGEYGEKAGTFSSVLCLLGIFISVLAQVVACSGLVVTLFPGVPVIGAALIAVVVMCFYVVFGGAWGAGMGGVVKLILLCGAGVISFIYIMRDGGPAGLWQSLNQALVGTELGSIQQSLGNLPAESSSDLARSFLNLTARGPMKDIGSGISLLLGVLSTQTYAQAVWSASSDKKAKQGALLSAFLIPLVGIAGISIGLYMRAHYITQAEAAALAAAGVIDVVKPVLNSTIQVFPIFIMDHMPPLVAGIIIGTLLLSVVGGGAGLSLGMVTILVKDVYKKLMPAQTIQNNEVKITRISLAVILFAAAGLNILIPGSTINDLGFLSMGLRGSVVFVPLACALWFPGRIRSGMILLSIIVAPLAVIVGKFCGSPVDPLFIGIGVSILMALAGGVMGTGSEKTVTGH